MVLIKEYRVVLPCSVEEYQVGQLFSVAEASKNETGGGEGIQVLRNEPYEKENEKGQFTHKVYYLESKVPQFIQVFAPAGSLLFHEQAWNAYPYCRTIVTNEYMKDNFFIKIETWHKPDLGSLENVHNLDEETWKSVEVIPIDITDNSQVADSDYKPDEDPTTFKSVKTGRGPLGPNWKKELTDCPRMCAYKLVTVKFKWWGMQTKMENFIHMQEKRIFTNFHRQLFCWIDKWVELTMEDIRQMEMETQKKLDEQVAGQVPSKKAVVRSLTRRFAAGSKVSVGSPRAFKRQRNSFANRGTVEEPPPPQSEQTKDFNTTTMRPTVMKTAERAP